jgi:hypothetical protein
MSFITQVEKDRGMAKYGEIFANVIEQDTISEEMKTEAGKDKWFRERYGDEIADCFQKVTHGKNYQAVDSPASQTIEQKRMFTADDKNDYLLRRIIKLENEVSEMQRDIIAEFKN